MELNNQSDKTVTAPKKSKKISRLKQFFRYGSVEYAYRHATNHGNINNAKTIGQEMGKITHVFAGCTTFMALTYIVVTADSLSVSWWGALTVILTLLAVYSTVSLIPRLLLLIPGIINMYTRKRQKTFYLMMIFTVIVSLSVFKLAWP